ncbi:ankyrin repeat family protein [Mycena amicta]|nr:ankyrin repeat family protein [Mycena amicta]
MAAPIAIDKNQLTVHIKVKGHHMYPRAMQNISVTIKHPQHKTVASMSALRIVPTLCHGQFLQMLDEEEDELHEFSIQLFNKYGNIQPHLVEPGYRSGSGCWGREMDNGMLLYVFWLSVNETFRGQGIGSWALEKFLQSDEVRQDDTVICWPTPIGRFEDSALWETTKTRQIAFFRKNHFRRIGRTVFFGYSPKADHPSRRVSADEDVGESGDDFSDPGPELMKQRYPLHLAIVEDESDNIAVVIQSFYNKDPASIHSRDANGFTPIHMAAGQKNLVAVRKLLTWDLRADLQNVSNVNGVNPLKLLQLEMQSSRSFTEMLLVNWRGYSTLELTVEYLLKQAMPGQEFCGSLQNYIAKRKYGCTCDQCVGGWLSPRMRFQLRYQAGYATDMMPEYYDDFPRGQPAAFSEILNARYLPRRFQPELYLSFYKGYRDVFDAAYMLLDTTNELLSADNLKHFLCNDSAVYFRKGGRIAFVFDAITESAFQQSELGDDYNDLFSDSNSEDESDWTLLPTCVNDFAFQLVRLMLDLNPKEQWGPYDLPVQRQENLDYSDVECSDDE